MQFRPISICYFTVSAFHKSSESGGGPHENSGADFKSARPEDMTHAQTKVRAMVKIDSFYVLTVDLGFSLRHKYGLVSSISPRRTQ
jgi:hypothetical protein